jgi:hypothetical protein
VGFPSEARRALNDAIARTELSLDFADELLEPRERSQARNCRDFMAAQRDWWLEHTATRGAHEAEQLRRASSQATGMRVEPACVLCQLDKSLDRYLRLNHERDHAIRLRAASAQARRQPAWIVTSQ